MSPQGRPTLPKTTASAVWQNGGPSRQGDYHTCKQIEFVRNICADMGVELQGRLVLAVDNTACIDIANDVGVSGRTKHFNRAIHYLRDLTQLRRVLPFYINTEQQCADGYTKALDKSKFVKWMSHVVS